MSNSNLFPHEVSQVRAVCGQLMWLAVQGCPSLLVAVSLVLGHVATSTVETLIEVNKLVRRAFCESRDHMFLYAHVDPVVPSWSDAAFAIRRDGSSQGGGIVALANGDSLNGKESPISIISWESQKAASSG